MGIYARHHHKAEWSTFVEARRWQCGLYQSPNGHWYIGGAAAETKQFSCAAGFLRYGKICSGVIPHQLDSGCWQWGDKISWHIDADISATAMLPEEKAQWEYEEAPRKEAECIALEQEPEVSVNICHQKYDFPI